MRISEKEKKEILNKAAISFAFDPGEASEVPGHEGGRNLVYRIGARAFLRISGLTDRTADDYLAETEYVHFLAEGGAAVADSIPSGNGNRVELIDGMAVSLFTPAKGDQIADHGYRYRDGAPIEEYFFNCGKTLGRIHALSKKYRPTHARFDFFDKYNEGYFEQLIPDDFLCLKTITGRRLKDSLHKLLERLRALDRSPQNYGMVHFDYSDGNYNIEYDTGRINVFDFDNCRTCWYMFDIANLWSHGLGWVARNPDPDARHAYMDAYMREVVRGYRTECEIGDEELQNLELMVNAVLMENIIDNFEVFRAAGAAYDFDEEQSYHVKCFADGLPWLGFYSDVFSVDAPFEVQL